MGKLTPEERESIAEHGQWILDYIDVQTSEIDRLLTEHEKEKNLLLTVLYKQTTEIDQLKGRLKEASAKQAFKEWDRNQKLISEFTAAVLNLTRDSSEDTYKLYEHLIKQGEEVSRGKL